MNGEDLLNLASHLIVNTAFGNAEARYRTAISRAYYGAFHIAVDFLKEMGKSVPANHSGHEVVYRLLFNSNVQDAIDAARSLNDLRRDRNRADYDLNRSGFQLPANAMERAELAHKFKLRIDRCRVEPVRSVILATLGSI